MGNEQIINLSFDDGWKRVSFNGDPDRTIRWNPNDAGFVDRFIAFQTWVNGDFKAKLKEQKIDKDRGLEDYKEGILGEMGAELNNALDGCFNVCVSVPAFQGVNPLSPMSNGNLMFINLLEALFPLIEKSINDFEGARKKYTEAAKKRSSGPVHPAYKKP